MIPALTLWSHALAALFFGGLAIAHARVGRGLPRGSFVAALALTALWALAMAGIGPGDVATRITESARNVAWFLFLYGALRSIGTRPGAGLVAILGVAILVCVATGAIAITEAAIRGADFYATRLALRMMVAVAGLVVIDRVATGAPARGGLRLALAALAMLWSADLIVYAVGWFVGTPVPGLIAARGVGLALLPALLAVAIHRPADGELKLSRTFAFRSLALAAVAIYVVAMMLATGWFAEIGGRHARLVQTAFVAGAGATLIAIIASPWLRAWVRVKVAKHLFDHRYDYRHEWLRFTATLGRSEAAAAPLEQRVVKALADLTDSPGGLLLVATERGLEPAGNWNWTGQEGVVEPALAIHLATDRIVDLDSLRRADTPEATLLPAWLVGTDEAWAVVPLIHRERLAGAVVLARPPIARALDWEDFDLLRVAGRQGASYLAEGRAVAALGEAQRFDEFNRRFAFIIHDVKNLVSQLTLVARNAERHADNPAFRADMIATLQESCGRMSALLQRLSQHSGARADPPRPTDLAALVRRIATRRRGQHRLLVSGTATALVDPIRFEQVLDHLIQNAIEASPADAPITLALAATPDTATVTVRDQGCGMTAAFVRDELFRPFASSKPGGFGIGAFEARQLAAAMQGSITVESQPGQGSRFIVSVPAATPLEAAA